MAKILTFAPRGLRLEWASAYVGLGRSKFLQLVASGDMPKPVDHPAVGRCNIWLRECLDTALDRLAGVDGDSDMTHPSPTSNPWDGDHEAQANEVGD